MKRLVIATRKSPLALVQAEMVAERLRTVLGAETELIKVVTSGDRQAAWSLEAEGGKGLFTAELEQHLLRGEADIAVHSAKDLPGESTPGLEIAGYLPRADARDVLVMREGNAEPQLIATGSPRRRLQLSRRIPDSRFTEIRGNVDTRLKKLAAGAADATVLAAAGLSRLGIDGWPGLEFRVMALGEMVPAVGQGAIAVQCRSADSAQFADILDESTGIAVALERALQAVLGAGCHTAFGAHVEERNLYFFHERRGGSTLMLSDADLADPGTTANRILKGLALIP